MGLSLLDMKSVSYRYPDNSWSLNDVSLSLRKHEFVAVIGPNGAGKSTLIKIAAGLLRPHEGSVQVHGRAVGTFPRNDLARELAYLPQDIEVHGDFSVYEIVGMGRQPYVSGIGFLGRQDHGIIQECMHKTDTIAYGDRRFWKLSGGERRRVLIASVLAQKPAILILDEPTISLDYGNQVAIFEIARQLTESGVGVITATHDLNLASLYSDTLIRMENGRIEACGEPATVLKEAPLRQAFGESLIVQSHPVSGNPAVLPTRKSP